MFTVSEDRIQLPALPLIHRRPRLLSSLEHFVGTSKRLITIYTPAGYGKSTLLADFAQTTNLPVCWCSLTSTERNPTAFLTLLAHSLIDRFQQIETKSLFEVIARGDTQLSIHYILDLMALLDPHIIVIDDYDKAVSAGLTFTLKQLLSGLPETSTVILASRYLSFQELEQVPYSPIGEAGISEKELRFTGEDIQYVTRKRFGRRLSAYEAEAIAEITHGNIAQILLIGHLMGDNQRLGRLKQQLDNREAIYHYLADKVFSKQSPDLQRFMVHTSVLPYLTEDVCNETLSIDNSQKCIETLAQDTSFLIRTEHGFRYSEFLGEFLRVELAEKEALHHQLAIKAGTVLASRSQFRESMNLYMSVQAWDEALSLLEEKGKFLYHTGHTLILYDWLTQFPQQKLRQYPRLLLLQGQILNDDLGRPSRALTLFQEAEERFHQRNDLIGVAEAQICQSMCTRLMRRTTESIDLSAEGLAQLEKLKADKQALAWARRNYGLAFWAKGNINAALTELRTALKMFEVIDDPYWIGSCHNDIGACLHKQGNITGANYHYEQAIRIWESLNNPIRLAETLNNLGSSLCLVRRYKEAREKFNESLDIALQGGAVLRSLALAKSGLGDTYLACSRYEEAIEAYTEAIEYAGKAEIQSLEIYSMVKLGECYYHQHDFTRSLNLANRAKDMAIEMELDFETGLACALQGRIHTRQALYTASFDLFAEALTALAENDVLEQAKVRLWLAYSLFCDLRVSAAFNQLQEAIRVASSLGELKKGLRPAVRETTQLLVHFLHWISTPAGMRDSILMLLTQAHEEIAVHRPGLQIFTFDLPMLVVAGKRRQFMQRGRARKHPEILAYLLIEGQGGGCRWNEICAAIWPDLDTERASTIFHQSIRRLREVVFEEPDYIIVRDDYYRINPYYYEWCDALAFEKLFDRISKSSLEESLPLQLELIDLYQGEFLAGFDLGHWGSTHRTNYETRFLCVVKMASKQLLNKGRPWEALHILDKGLTQNYFQEDLHCDILKAYAQLGLYGELQAHYQTLDKAFATELGFPPDLTVEKVYKMLIKARH